MQFVSKDIFLIGNQISVSQVFTAGFVFLLNILTSSGNSTSWKHFKFTVLGTSVESNRLDLQIGHTAINRVAINPDSKIRTTKKREKHTYATNKEKALFNNL